MRSPDPVTATCTACRRLCFGKGVDVRGYEINAFLLVPFDSTVKCSFPVVVFQHHIDPVHSQQQRNARWVIVMCREYESLDINVLYVSTFN